MSRTMHGVTTTASTTHCFAKTKTELWLRPWLAVAVLWLVLGGVLNARAQSSVAELTEMRVARSETNLLLDTSLRLELGVAIEDALMKGLAVHFVVEADLMRDRWYWYDRQVSSVSRHYRLAYQPLTRKWRLHVSREPLSASATLAASLTRAVALIP